MSVAASERLAAASQDYVRAAQNFRIAQGLKSTTQELERLRNELNLAKSRPTKERILGVLVTLLVLGVIATTVWIAMQYKGAFYVLPVMTAMVLSTAVGFYTLHRSGIEIGGANYGAAGLIMLFGSFIPAVCGFKRQAYLESQIKIVEAEKQRFESTPTTHQLGEK